ncbi:tetratricopeptide (TPR) repeat protein [Catenuloplanes nepalensis]|uniref:Tetratricopeptide (TPR) repeat protein n=1 Tax=Catenuloplanes nepalensis TaxID=587533 RepID=A0ABT9MQE2_9ACTN|nr:tetratricopeptide repeat protein [Catenuloplanes nepalensis]MDP9793296.1 tetratricopeptide (TPR) repeat protein [Catenuloplanes nepalensis]
MTPEPAPIPGLELPHSGTPVERLAALLRQLRRRQARRRGGPETTYRDLSARTGWSIGAISGYFAGRILPPTDRFDILVTLLGATPAERGPLATARDHAHESRRDRAHESRQDRAHESRHDRTPEGHHDPAPAPRQLPAVCASFAGRTRELAALDATPPGGIVTITGGAGVGKTSLAVHWGHSRTARFPDGQLFVGLRGFVSGHPPAGPAEVIRDLLEALGAAPPAIPPGVTARINLYRSLLAGRRMLLVLDDARDAEQVRPLLPGAAGCLTVVTSRHPLTGLTVVEGAHPLALGVLPPGEARALLAARLGPDRVAAEPSPVAELIHRCARLPLALAVVAARGTTRPDATLDQLARELRAAQGTLEGFTGDDPAADPRVAFAGSYRLLRPPAARLFRWLAAHPGPDLSEAAAASLTGTAVDAVRPALAELLRAHLIQEHQPGRYVLHDLLRAYALEQLRLTDGPDRRRAAVRRVLDHYLHSAHAAAALLHPDDGTPPPPAPAPGTTPETPAGRDEARRWLEREHRVLAGAVSHAAQHDFPRHTWQLARALTSFLDWRGDWHELAEIQRIALVAADDDPGRISAHRLLARAHNRLGRYDDARTHLTAAIALCRGAGLHADEARCHLNLSLTLELSGQHRAALEHGRRAVELFGAAGDHAGHATALGVVGWCHALLGEYGSALACCRRAVDEQTALGRESAPTLDSLGFAQHRLGRYAAAATAYRRAVVLYREAGDRYHEADTLIHLGDCHRDGGDDHAARAAWQRAREILMELRHPAVATVTNRLRVPSSAR